MAAHHFNQENLFSNSSREVWNRARLSQAALGARLLRSCRYISSPTLKTSSHVNQWDNGTAKTRQLPCELSLLRVFLIWV